MDDKQIQEISKKITGLSAEIINQTLKEIRDDDAENIINALRNATHKAGGVYWDMYTAMGGKNSMRAWVNANPQMPFPTNNLYA